MLRGGILAVAAVKRGMAGVVIDGACRDIAESDELGPAGLRAGGRPGQRPRPDRADRAWTSRSSSRASPSARATTSSPTAAASSSSPPPSAERVLDLAERIAAREQAMVEAVRAGESVVEVMHDSRFPKAEATHDEPARRRAALDRDALATRSTGSAARAACSGSRRSQNGQRLVGRAFTVRYRPAGHPPGTVGDYLDDDRAGPGRRARQRRPRPTARSGATSSPPSRTERGIAGTVIDGVSRDVRRALELGYPIYSRGRFMRTGKDRVEVAEVGGPVTIGGVQVTPGDLLVGDDDGVVVIARDGRAGGARDRARDRGSARRRS